MTASHEHRHEHGHGHGHEHDQGIRGMLRYAKHARSMWRSAINTDVLSKVAPQPGERVVDIGAGAGAGAVIAAKTGADVIAVEPTPYLRRVLGLRRLMQRDRDRIEVIDGSAEATGLDDQSVDAVWAVNTMHHWNDPVAGCREVARILRPGARVFLADEDFDDPTHPDYEKFSERHSDHAHQFQMVDIEQIADELRGHGLDVRTGTKIQLGASPTFVIDASKPTT